MRPVEACTHRERPRPVDGVEYASCRLLGALSGLGEADTPPVGHDACAACCAHPLPSRDRINPVLASLLGRLADAVAAAGGRPGCDPARAAALAAWARRHLRAEFADGDPPGLPRRATARCISLAEGPAPGHQGSERQPSYVCNFHNIGIQSLDVCHRCRDWSDRPRSGVTIERLLPPPGARCGPAVRRWAVGVTTAPRGLSTIDWSLDSLVRAGWESVHLFEDTPVPLAGRSAGVPSTIRGTRVGAWPNYYLALAELLLREPEADAFLVAQDDALFFSREDQRGYLERVLWPGESPGLVSLYCSAAYTPPEPGWHRHQGRWVWGALAFIFPRELAKQFVTDRVVLEHRWSGPDRGLTHIDVVIGAWADRCRIPIHYPAPSLVQHIGDVSTLWQAERATGKRRADLFAGDDA